MLKKPGMKLGLYHGWVPGPMCTTTISHAPLSGAAIRQSGSTERQKDFTVISEVCEELLMKKVLFPVGGWPSGNRVIETLRNGPTGCKQQSEALRAGGCAWDSSWSRLMLMTTLIQCLIIQQSQHIRGICMMQHSCFTPTLGSDWLAATRFSRQPLESETSTCLAQRSCLSFPLKIWTHLHCLV